MDSLEQTGQWIAASTLRLECSQQMFYKLTCLVQYCWVWHKGSCLVCMARIVNGNTLKSQNPNPYFSRLCFSLSYLQISEPHLDELHCLCMFQLLTEALSNFLMLSFLWWGASLPCGATSWKPETQIFVALYLIMTASSLARQPGHTAQWQQLYLEVHSTCPELHPCRLYTLYLTTSKHACCQSHFRSMQLSLTRKDRRLDFFQL